MKIAKAVLAGIIVSLAGVLCVGIGAAVTASEVKDADTSYTHTREGVYELEDNLDKNNLQFIFDASEVSIHTTDKDHSYVAYSLNGVTNINTDNNQFEVYQQSGLSWFYWLNIVGQNEVDIFLSKACMEEDSLNIILNAGDISMDKDISLKNFSIEMNAGNMEIDGLKAEKVNIEINAGNIEIKDLEVMQLEFEVNAGNLEIGFINPESWYDIESSVSLGDLKISPIGFETGKHSMPGSKSGYSIVGSVNVGNVELAFKSE